MRRPWTVCLVLAVAIAGPGCAPDRVATPSDPSPDPSTVETSTGTPVEEPSKGSIAWLDVQLTDAVTGEQFRLSDYKGKPVLLHAFAVW